MDITTPTSLAAGSLLNRLQVGCDDLQGPHNSDTNKPQSESHVAPACTDITLVGRSAAHQAFHQNRIREARFSALHQLSGTRYQNRSPTATHCQCLNVD